LILIISVAVFFQAAPPTANAQTRVGALTLNTGENDLRSAVIDVSGGFAYFGTDTSPGRVVKVRLSDFTRVGALTLNTGENDLWSAVIDVSGGFAYFGTDTDPGRVVKVRLSDFSRVGALTLNAGYEEYLRSAVIDAGNGFAYFGTLTNIVVKVRLSDFTRVGALTLNAGEGSLCSAVIDAGNGFAYFGTYASPGRVVKVRLSDFSRVGALTLNAGEEYLRSAVIDAGNGFAYFGTYLSPGRVVKVRLSDFSRVGALTLNTDENSLMSPVIDASGGFAYFGTGTYPGRVVKVRLSDFTRVGALTLNAGENAVWSAVIDVSGGFAYFGIITSPGRVVKVKISDLTTTPFGTTVSTVFADTSYTLGFMGTGNIYDDSGIGFMYAHRSPLKIIFPKTDTSRVSPTGQPTWSGYTHLVTVGGRGANPTLAYYEDNGLATLKFYFEGGNYVIKKGTTVAYTIVPSSVTTTNDYFVMETIPDGTHTVISLWGIGAPGTYASGIYFDGVFPTLSSLTQGWYIVRWQDLNSNGFPDYPTEFTIVASG